MKYSNAITFIDEFKLNKNFDLFAKLLIQQKDLLPEIIQLTTSSTYPYASYSSWILSHVQLNDSTITNQFSESIIDQFLITKDHSAQRNLLLIIYRSKFTAHKEGEMIDYLFKLLLDSNSKVALKVNALYALKTYFKLYPELRNELLAVKSILEVNSTPSLNATFKKLKI